MAYRLDELLYLLLFQCFVAVIEVLFDLMSFVKTSPIRSPVFVWSSLKARPFNLLIDWSCYVYFRFSIKHLSKHTAHICGGIIYFLFGTVRSATRYFRSCRLLTFFRFSDPRSCRFSFFVLPLFRSSILNVKSTRSENSSPHKPNRNVCVWGGGGGWSEDKKCG